MKHRETQARKTYVDAQRAVIQACEDLREAEMFLDSFERGERSAVGGAAARVVSSADIANTHASNLRESAVGGAAAEYLAREGQQSCGSRLPSLSEIIVDRHTTKFHAGHEGGEHFNSLPERIEFRSHGELPVSITISAAQSDFECVLLALQSLLDVVESGSKGGASGHGCHSSSSVRCGGCTASCGLAGVTHLTGEGAIRGADGSPSSASSSAHSSGAEGSRGLPGASAHTPAGHTVQVSKYKFLRRREDSSARG